MRLAWFSRVALVLALIWSVLPAVTRGQEPVAPADLAAMALLPSDVGSTGLTIFRSRSFTRAQRATEVAPYIGVPIDSAISSLERYGYINGYELSLAAPVDPAAEQPQAQLVITSYIMQYETDLGARKAFKLFEDEGSVATAKDVKGSGKVADRSEITTDSGVAGDSGVPLSVMDLSFVDGSFYAGVALIAYDWQGAAVSIDGLPALETASVEALVGTLRAKIASVVAMGEPGLFNSVLRVSTDQPTAVDFYETSSGRPLAVFGQPVDSVQPERLTGAIASYRVEQSLGNPYYRGELLQFGSPEEASAWIAGDLNLVSDAIPGYSNVADAQTTQVYGDESRARGYTYQAGEETSVIGFALYARVGSIVVAMQLDASPSVAIAAAEAMLATQVDCLVAGGACAPITVPADIVQQGP